MANKNVALLVDPLIDDNPVAVQVLGICSALAVTAQLKPSFIMAISVIAVIVCSNVIISLLRKLIPNRIKIIAELAIIATLVILVELILKAYQYEAYTQLSVFVGLIITNCIVMGRAEAYALHNGPASSLLDGLGSGMGYGVVILLVGFFRELFGSGKVFGFNFVQEWNLTEIGYANNVLMVLPPGAFFILGMIIWLQRQKTKKWDAN